MPIPSWLLYADHALARIWRSLTPGRRDKPLCGGRRDMATLATRSRRAGSWGRMGRKRRGIARCSLTGAVIGATKGPSHQACGNQYRNQVLELHRRALMRPEAGRCPAGAFGPPPSAFLAGVQRRPLRLQATGCRPARIARCRGPGGWWLRRAPTVPVCRRAPWPAGCVDVAAESASVLSLVSVWYHIGKARMNS